MKNDFLNLAKRVKALSDIGTLYCKNEYDKDRYEELQNISLEMMRLLTATTLPEVRSFYKPVIDYPTPKVDIRGMVLNDKNEILLVQESADERWSLPGGWADIGLTPKEVVIKEINEETGLEVEVENLLAVFDKKCHPHPPEPFYVYKLIFHCRLLSTKINKGFDVLDAGFFAINDLPPISEDRILASQIEFLYQKIMAEDTITTFD